MSTLGRVRTSWICTRPTRTALAVGVACLAMVALLALPPRFALAQEADAQAEDGGRTVLDRQLETQGDEALLEETDDPDAIARFERRREEIRAQREERDAARRAEQLEVRQRQSYAAGWTLMHADTTSRVGLWLTHGNDDVARFFHDLHLFGQVGFNIQDFEVALFSMWGMRFQATSRATGLDALWFGGKVQIPSFSAESGLLAASLTLGLPTNQRRDGRPAVFADHANTLISVGDLTLDLGLFATIYFEDSMGMNVQLNMQFPFGMPTVAVFNAGLEAYSRLGLPRDEAERAAWNGWSTDVRGGIQISTGFTPLVLYVEWGPIYEEVVRLAVRGAVLIGAGANLGNASDLQLLFVCEWRFGHG